jgi:hypothetical protein
VKRPSRYLKFRMKSRGITKKEINYVLANPETVYPSRDHPDRTVIMGTTWAARRLKVVVLTADQEHVVTVADRDAER